MFHRFCNLAHLTVKSWNKQPAPAWTQSARCLQKGAESKGNAQILLGVSLSCGARFTTPAKHSREAHHAGMVHGSTDADRRYPPFPSHAFHGFCIIARWFICIPYPNKTAGHTGNLRPICPAVPSLWPVLCESDYLSFSVSIHLTSLLGPACSR